MTSSLHSSDYSVHSFEQVPNFRGVFLRRLEEGIESPDWMKGTPDSPANLGDGSSLSVKGLVVIE